MKDKTVEIDENIYERLIYLKEGNETVSDLIERLAKKQLANYSDFHGTLSSDTIKSIKKMKEKKKKSKVIF